MPTGTKLTNIHTNKMDNEYRENYKQATNKDVLLCLIYPRGWKS